MSLVVSTRWHLARASSTSRASTYISVSMAGGWPAYGVISACEFGLFMEKLAIHGECLLPRHSGPSFHSISSYANFRFRHRADETILVTCQRDIHPPLLHMKLSPRFVGSGEPNSKKGLQATGSSQHTGKRGANGCQLCCFFRICIPSVEPASN